MHSPITFQKFQIFEVIVPAHSVILSAPEPKGNTYKDNLRWDHRSICLVEATLSNGLVAVGEALRTESAECVKTTLEFLKGKAIQDFHPVTLWKSNNLPDGLPLPYFLPSSSAQTGHKMSYSLIETLWYDAAGKSANLPAHALLGGKFHDSIPVDFWANRPEANTLCTLVEQAVSLGLRGMKLKSDGTGDTAETIIRAAADLPSWFHFTIDPMCSWRSLRESRSRLDRLQNLQRSFILEDPFNWYHQQDWQLLKQQYSITLATHARDEVILRHSIKNELASIYNLGATSTGFSRQGSTLQLFGFDCWMGSSLELGVMQHLRLHIASTTPNCVLPSDFQSEWVREHTLITQRMQYEDGHAIVPDRPGLGVDLDHAAVKSYLQSSVSI